MVLERNGARLGGKERRRHLHRQIEKHRYDITHVTERKASPQTFVCTKTQDSYECRRTQYGVERELLAELEELTENQLGISALKRELVVTFGFWAWSTRKVGRRR